MASYYRLQLENWLKTLTIKTGRVLDVGGAANPVSGRIPDWKVEHYRIIDNTLEAPKRQPDAIFDIEQEAIPYNLPDGYDNFDAVFCLEVMEYVLNPKNALRNLAFFLKPGGLLFITFPFVYAIHNPAGADYLRYTPDGARKLLGQAGFDIVQEVARETYTGSLASFYAKEGMRYRKDTNQEILGMIFVCKYVEPS